MSKPFTEGVAKPKQPTNPPVSAMTARDYFAAAALTGLLARSNSSGNIPATAYNFADIMLKERRGG